MKEKNDLSQEEIMKVLHYDQHSGVFTWIAKSSTKTIVGSTAGHTHHLHRRVVITINGFKYLAHRLAWLYMTGEWPKNVIDHIDGDSTNNKWVNLRDVTQGGNTQNQRSGHINSQTSKKLGVSFDKSRCKYSARICVNGHQRLIGRFLTEDEAYNAYLVEKRKVHSTNTL